MKINININPQELSKINRPKKYDLGNIVTTMQDLLDNSEITIEDNLLPILVINGNNYMLPDLETKYSKLAKRNNFNIQESDLISFNGSSNLGLQETIDIGNQWEGPSGNAGITISENFLFYEASEPVESTSASVNVSKDGRTILSSYYKSSLLSRFINNTIGSRANGFLHLISEITNYANDILRRSEIIFYEATGIRMSSHVGGSGFGVNITTDNLTEDIDVQFGESGGTVAYEENSIPITGTQVGNPVTGDVEFKEGYTNISLFQKNFDEDNFSRITFEDSGLRISGKSFDETEDTSLKFYKNGISVEKNGNSLGIYSGFDYSNINPENPLIYAQRSYVNKANSYSTTETLTGGTWIDNKPIYRKVLVYNTDNFINLDTFEILHNLNIDTYLKHDVVVVEIGQTGLSEKPAVFNLIDSTHNDASSPNYIFNLDVLTSFNTNSIFSEAFYKTENNVDFCLILEYTKTTD